MLNYIPFSEELFLALFPVYKECLKYLKDIVKPKTMADILSIDDNQVQYWFANNAILLGELRQVKNLLSNKGYLPYIQHIYLTIIQANNNANNVVAVDSVVETSSCEEEREDIETKEENSDDTATIVEENQVEKVEEVVVEEESAEGPCEQVDEDTRVVGTESVDMVDMDILSQIPFDVEVLSGLFSQYRRLFVFLEKHTNLRKMSDFVRFSELEFSRLPRVGTKICQFQQFKEYLSNYNNQLLLVNSFNESGLTNIDIDNGNSSDTDEMTEGDRMISAIPFNADMIEILLPQFRTCINSFRGKNISTIADFMRLTTLNVSRWNGFGANKIAEFNEIKTFLSNVENHQKIQEVYDLCFVNHEFPENLSLEEEELSLEGKIGLAIKQYIDFLTRKSEYKGSLRDDLERIKLLFVERKSNKEIARVLNITEERVRQLKVTKLKEMFDGELKDAENFKFSDSLKNEIEYFLGRLPVICSEEKLCSLLQCEENYEESASSLILRLNSPVKGEKFLDQQYFISKEASIRWAKDYIKYIIGVLGYSTTCKIYDIRPVNIDSIMDMLEANNSDFGFDRDVVFDILDQHTWIEKLTIDDVDLYQLKYEYLKINYKCIGRLVYENKELNTNDLDDIHRRKLNNRDEQSIDNGVNTAKMNLSWVVQGSGSGILKYSESGERMKNLRTVVKEWVSGKEVFSFNEVMHALNTKGYTNLNESSVRTYLSDGCYVERNNPNLFCNIECVEKYLDKYSWRNKSQHGVVNWLVRTVYGYLIEKENYGLPISDIKAKVKKDINSSGYELRNDVLTYIIRYTEGDEALFSYKNEILSLTKLGLEKAPKEWEIVGLRNRTPDYYGVIISNIIAILREATGGEMLMSDVKKMCLEGVDSPAQASFYKIVDRHLPKQVSKIDKEGKPYLKLEQDKIEYVDSMVVQMVEKDNEIVEEVVVTREERPIYTIGSRTAVDWDLLRKNFIKDYPQSWFKDVDKEKSVDKFIRFMNQLNPDKTTRISVTLPRHFMHFLFYQNDKYSYEMYLTDILTCYERLLKEIYKDNTGQAINNTHGLSQTVNAFPEVKEWVDNGGSTFNGYYNNLHTDRNKQTHGDELNKSLASVVLSISQYIALYIYTVAKFWKEK